jgi:hypothetical protein
MQRRPTVSTRTRTSVAPRSRAQHLGPGVLQRRSTVSTRTAARSRSNWCFARHLGPGMSPPLALLGRARCRHGPSRLLADCHALPPRPTSIRCRNSERPIPPTVPNAPSRPKLTWYLAPGYYPLSQNDIVNGTGAKRPAGARTHKPLAPHRGRRVPR